MWDLCLLYLLLQTLDYLCAIYSAVGLAFGKKFSEDEKLAVSVYVLICREVCLSILASCSC